MTISNKRDFLRGDKQIWFIYIILSLFSIVVVYSATSNLAFREREGNTEFYLVKHTAILLLSFAFATIISRINFQLFARWLRIALYLTPIILVYTYAKGENVGGAARWINLFGISLQTSDVARLVLIANLALMLSQRQHIEEDAYKLSTLNSILFWCGLICGLLVPTSFSTSVILAVTCLMVMLVGRVPWKHLFKLFLSITFGIALFVGVCITFESQDISFGRSSTIVDRTEAFLGTDLDGKSGIGGRIGKNNSQRDYALIAVASGGILGVGPGHSYQKYKLPLAYSDYIYTIIIEEYGLVGGIVTMGLYLWLLYRGVFNIDNTQRPFGGLLCIGLTISIVFQAMAHMFISVGLGPVTGQTLPMISLGGSSALLTSIAIGMVLSVTHFEQKPVSKKRIRSKK
jgi:cell division protein FtsW